MQSFFWHVLADKKVYNRLNTELDQAVHDGTIPATGNLSWNEAQALPYLQACLREAMRVRPAVGLNITRIVPKEGTELDGHAFAAGTRIAVNGWVLHRDHKTFGEDADDFRPERWLEDEERARVMDRYMFQVRISFLIEARAVMSRYTDLPVLAVRRWEPRLYRPQSGAAGDQQGHSSSHTRLPLRAGASGPGDQGFCYILRRAGRLGGVCAEEGVRHGNDPGLWRIPSCVLW